MANTYKDIVITPFRGDANNDPIIKFSAGDASTNSDMNVRFYATSNGTLSFEGTAGQLFSITNDLSGTLFSVNDISGIPSLEIDANGKVSIAHFGGNVGIGTSNAQYKLDVAGIINVNNSIIVAGMNVVPAVQASFGQANTSRDHANASFGQANTARTHANAAFEQANTARIHANTAHLTANAAYDQANTARIHANTAHLTANAAYDQANTARTHANTAHATANAAYGQANTARDHANTAHLSANAAYNQANTARDHANSAFAAANAAGTYANNTFLANTSNITFNGNLNFSGWANANNVYISNYLDIETRANAEYKEGRLYYSSEEKTFIGYGDYSDFEQTLGEREWVRCRNSTASTIYKGQAVYVTGVHIPGHPYHGHHPTIDLADASDINKKDVIGLAGHDIPSGDHGYVVVRGYIEGINTASLTSSSRVHLGFNGGIVNDAPEYPNWPMDVGICLTSNTTNGTMYVSLTDHSMERLRVQNSARVGGDLTVEGDLTILGSENKVTVNSLEVGTQFIYLGAGDSVNVANINFTGTGLNDLSIKGHYASNTTSTYYITISDVSPDKFSWGYTSDFSVLQQQNVTIQYQTSQSLSNGLSVYFESNTGHTLGDNWNLTAVGVSSDFGFVGNHIDGPNGYTHSGLFRDATDGTFKFFHSYDPEVEGAVDIGNTTFAYANVRTFRITGDEVYEGAVRLSSVISSAFTQANNASLAYDQANTARIHANTAHLTANAAYDQANTARTHANTAHLTANAAFNNANAAFVQANTARTHANTAHATANAAFNNANAAFVQANTARTHANTAHLTANAAYDQANTARTHANNAYNIANLAFDKANTGGGGGASVNVGNTVPTGNTQGDLWWNTELGTLLIYYDDGDSAQWVEASSFTVNVAALEVSVPSAFNQANAAYAQANAAFDAANNVGGGAYFQGNNGDVGSVEGLGDIFRVHTNTLTVNTTIYSGNNALAAGPLTIATNRTLVIQTGARVSIV